VQNIAGPASVCTGNTITLTDATTGGIWNTYNSGIATVSTEGVVKGISSGTVTIAYIINSVCGMVVRTKSIVVNATPAVGSITGTATVCAGFTTQLSDATPGGQWTSSNPAVATISSSGLVTGAAAGSSTITYTVNTATCGLSFATRTVTVNGAASVAAITGNTSLCIGSTSQLADGTSGGVWNTSDGTVASISTRGLVTAHKAGSVTITYSVSTSCGQVSARTTLTVGANPTVAAIGGASSLCVNATIQLSDATAGGTWHSSNTRVVTVTTAGLVRAIGRGTASITYSVSNNCGLATATKSISVNCGSARGFADVTSDDTVVSKEETLDVTFDAQVFPNPSQTDFTLTVHSSNTTTAAYVRIFDMAGRFVDEKRGAIGEPIRFGAGFVQGMYVVQVMQGDKHKVIKVIKN
jgi:hypothetical protein